MKTGEAPRITRRGALGVLGAGALAAALWPRHTADDVPPGRRVVEYWEKWGGPEAAALATIVARFNGTQDRYWVRLVQVGDIAAKAAVAIGGGDPPDVVGLYSYNIPQFSESRAVMRLDEFGSDHTAPGLDPGEFAPAVAGLLTHEGRLWAGVNTVYTLGLYYNRAAFREAGIERPPRTIPELDAAAERLVKRGADGRLERAGFLQNMPGWWPYSWPVLFGGRLYDAQTSRAVFADAPTVAAYEWVGSYPGRLGVRESSEFANAHSRGYHTAQDPFFTGRVAMIAQGPWIANFIRSRAPSLEYGAVPMPVAAALYEPRSPLGLVEADVLVIPRGCRNPQGAFEFVRFMQTREVQEELALAHCKSSPMRDVSEGFVQRHPHPYIGVHDAAVRSPRAQVLPQTRVWQQYADMTIGAFESIWAGEPVLPVLRQVETRAQALMDLAATRRLQRGARAGGEA